MTIQYHIKSTKKKNNACALFLFHTALVFLFNLFRLHDGDVSCRGNRGNRVLVHQLLFSVIFNDNGKIIKLADSSPDLETVYQIDHHGQAFLQIHQIFVVSCICHGIYLLVYIIIIGLLV